ncbi:hypothetical protein PR202_gb12708 [Eleusine coracana subsp. coracana]|uniref:MLO-like protein n=1 Tax=Eleusine coracana subsp. coracana TaxID=191504 RepID=A0AAV5ERT5_ELECO|nr:hypothetical protein PR202_gb12708 [Eleusine coracana subsp. coracana]
MAGGGTKAGDGPVITLEHTPMWIVASVCSVIVLISLLFERMLHRLGKRLMKSSQKPLYDALLKIKEGWILLQLMLLGFISLLLTVFQGATQKICVQESLMHHLLPCPVQLLHYDAKNDATVFSGVLGGARRLLAGGGAADDYCLRKRSFFKQFYGSVTEEDYTAMRLGFIAVSYGFNSCIMGKPTYVITRLVISVVSQLLCCYSTLPLYAIVSHVSLYFFERDMGSSFKKAIFDDNVSEGLVNWAQNARRRKANDKTNADVAGSSIHERSGGAVQIMSA